MLLTTFSILYFNIVQSRDTQIPFFKTTITCTNTLCLVLADTDAIPVYFLEGVKWQFSITFGLLSAACVQHFLIFLTAWSQTVHICGQFTIRWAHHLLPLAFWRMKYYWWTVCSFSKAWCGCDDRCNGASVTRVLWGVWWSAGRAFGAGQRLWHREGLRLHSFWGTSDLPSWSCFIVFLMLCVRFHSEWNASSLSQSPDSVMLALKLDGSTLLDRKIRVKRSVKKEKVQKVAPGRPSGRKPAAGSDKKATGRGNRPSAGGFKGFKQKGQDHPGGRNVQTKASFKGEMTDPTAKKNKGQKKKFKSNKKKNTSYI